MDANGARMLRNTLAERQWWLADAVADGRQPPVDPDADHLELVGDGERLYVLPARNGGRPRRLRKTLVDGFWKPQTTAD